MGTRTVVIIKHIESDKFLKRSYSNEKEAIELENTLTNENYNKYEIVGLIKEKRSGHQWYLYIKNPKKDWEEKVMSFYSKKSCKLAAKLIKKYDNDLITTYSKIY
nr:MAG TPA: hypothetical protein [Microviridae sp.]